MSLSQSKIEHHEFSFPFNSSVNERDKSIKKMLIEKCCFQSAVMISLLV